ncbi:MAG: hypothetical protein WCD86_00685, partial [Ktedonobacteraceae bacterium]
GQMYAPGTGGGNSGNGNPPPPPNHGPVPCVGQDCGSNPPHQPKPLSPKQLAQLCVQSVQCMYAVQRYDDAQQSAYEQYILQFGMAFFEAGEGNPEVLEQDLEEYQISEIELQNLGPGPYDNKILRAFDSSNTGTQLEGEMALIARMGGYNITDFNHIYNGPDGTITDVDAAVPGVILEAKSGRAWDSEDTNKLYIKLGDGPDGQLVNPDKNPVLVYAPSMPENKVQWIQNTGTWVAQNETQLIIMLWYLSPP